MSHAWSFYFDDTNPEDYCYIGFYKYRQKQKDFSSNFRQESDKLRKDLENLTNRTEDQTKKNHANRLLNLYKNHRENFSEVNTFWCGVELKNGFTVAENRAVRSIVTDTAKTVTNVINNILKRKHDDTVDDEVDSDNDKIVVESDGCVDAIGNGKRKKSKTLQNNEVSDDDNTVNSVVDSDGVVDDGKTITLLNNEVSDDDGTVSESDGCIEITTAVDDEKKKKRIQSWQHAIYHLNISAISNHDWVVDGYNISESFRNFQRETIERLKTKPELSYVEDIDEILSLSSILYVKEDMPTYMNCAKQVWKNALHDPLTPVTLPTDVQLMIIDYNTLLSDKEVLSQKWRKNWIKCDSFTKEDVVIFEAVQIIIRNFVQVTSASSSGITIDEDTFAHKYCHSILEEIFNTSDFKLHWANGESISSKQRRENNYGRKPDFRVVIEENEFVFGEIKPPNAANSKKTVNHTLVKLAEFMKGSLDLLHERFGYSQHLETFGILIRGYQIELFGMDLPFDGLYRCKQLGTVLLPSEKANFLNIITTVSMLYSLLEKVNRSVDELYRPRTPTPSGCSYKRKSWSSPKVITKHNTKNPD